jgi:hypothetical protein
MWYNKKLIYSIKIIRLKHELAHVMGIRKVNLSCYKSDILTRPIKAFHEEILIKVILILYSLETGRIHCINPPVQLNNKLMIKHLS